MTYTVSSGTLNLTLLLLYVISRLALQYFVIMLVSKHGCNGRRTDMRLSHSFVSCFTAEPRHNEQFSDRRRVADEDETVLDDAHESSSAASQDRGNWCQLALALMPKYLLVCACLHSVDVKSVNPVDA